MKEISDERTRQNKKFGEQNNNLVEWVAVLTEEVGEVAKEAVDYHFRYGMDGLTAPEAVDLKNERKQNYRKECIRVAAVAVAMVESLDRQLDK